MKKISSNDIYWVAGLLDGEGYFHYNSTPQITISQIDLDLVEKVRYLLGECPPIKHYKSNNDKHKDNYTLTVNGILAVSWMMTLYSIMSLRRRIQIREVINSWKSSKNRSKNSDHCRNGHPLIEEKDYYWQENTQGGQTKICRICKNEYQRNRNGKKSFAKLIAKHKNISIEQARQLIEEMSNKMQ